MVTCDFTNPESFWSFPKSGEDFVYGIVSNGINNNGQALDANPDAVSPCPLGNYHKSIMIIFISFLFNYIDSLIQVQKSFLVPIPESS